MAKYNKTLSGRAAKVLVAGTLFTLLNFSLGVGLGIKWGAPFQGTVISFLVEILCICISASFQRFLHDQRLASIQHIIRQIERGHKENLGALLQDLGVVFGISRLANFGEYPYFQRYLSQAISGLRNLLEGEHEIVAQHTDDVWNDHREHLRVLVRGEVFLATCYVSNDEEISETFSNLSYGEYLRDTFALTRRGVQVKKLYIFEEEALRENPIIKNHFDEARKFCIQRPGELSVSLIVRPKAFRSTDLDFMLWDDKLVAVSRIDRNGRLCGLWLSRKSEHIKEYRDKFYDLFNHPAAQELARVSAPASPRETSSHP